MFSEACWSILVLESISKGHVCSSSTPPSSFSLPSRSLSLCCDGFDADSQDKAYLQEVEVNVSKNKALIVDLVTLHNKVPFVDINSQC